MKCPNCGKEIAEDSMFCEFCGTKIESKKSKIVWWIIGFVVLLFILLFCVFTNSEQPSDEEDLPSMVNVEENVRDTAVETPIDSIAVLEKSTTTEEIFAQPKSIAPQPKKQQQSQQITSTIQSEEFVDENNDEVYVIVEDKPEFPGGDAAMMKYLSENIKYPVIAQENGIQGRVICQFVVNEDGSIVDINVVRSVDPSLDKEAIRVIKSMPKWKPGMQGGKAVRTKYTIPIGFRLQ